MDFWPLLDGCMALGFGSSLQSVSGFFGCIVLWGSKLRLFALYLRSALILRSTLRFILYIFK